MLYDNIFNNYIKYHNEITDVMLYSYLPHCFTCYLINSTWKKALFYNHAHMIHDRYIIHAQVSVNSMIQSCIMIYIMIHW